MSNNDYRTYLLALGQMFEQSEQAVRRGDGSPPWSVMFDADACPTNALQWLAQFIGVQLEPQNIVETPDVYWARQRQRIKNHQGFQRGSPGAMKAAAQLWLTGNKTLFFKERDGDPYFLTVVTRTNETPDANVVLRELLAQKPAGIILTYITAATRTFAETTATGNTFTASLAEWPTFHDRTGV